MLWRTSSETFGTAQKAARDCGAHWYTAIDSGESLNSAAGPFEILEILGEGSFGTVCVARVTGDHDQISTRHEVAIATTALREIESMEAPAIIAASANRQLRRNRSTSCRAWCNA